MKELLQAYVSGTISPEDREKVNADISVWYVSVPEGWPEIEMTTKVLEAYRSKVGALTRAEKNRVRELLAERARLLAVDR